MHMSPVAFRPHSCRQLTFDEAWEFGPICQGIWRRESWFEDVVEGSSDEEEVNEGVVVIDWDRENRRSRIVATDIVRAARSNAIWRPLGFEYSLDQEKLLGAIVHFGWKYETMLRPKCERWRRTD